MDVNENKEIESNIKNDAEDNLEVNILTPQNVSFRATAGGFLACETSGREYERVAVYRAFPFTDPDRYISIREFDQKAAEIGLIKDLNEFDAETADLLRYQINIRYFTPKITKIVNIKDEYGYAYFDVETDKGNCRFTIHMHGGSVTRLSETRLIIKDIDGNRFEIEDLRKLSIKEAKKIDVYI